MTARAKSQSPPSGRVFEQLDFRSNEQVQAALFWERGTGAAVMAVLDRESCRYFEVPVRAAQSVLDMLRHPLAYCSRTPGDR